MTQTRRRDPTGPSSVAMIRWRFSGQDEVAIELILASVIGPGVPYRRDGGVCGTKFQPP